MDKLTEEDDDQSLEGEIEFRNNRCCYCVVITVIIVVIVVIVVIDIIDDCGDDIHSFEFNIFDEDFEGEYHCQRSGYYYYYYYYYY